MSVVKINAISVAEGQGPALEERFNNRKGLVDECPGFEGFQLLRPVAGETRYFVVTQWKDEASFQAWREGKARDAHSGPKPATPITTGATLLEFEVVS